MKLRKEIKRLQKSANARVKLEVTREDGSLVKVPRKLMRLICLALMGGKVRPNTITRVAERYGLKSEG
jgi:hypothetical protein